MMDGLISIELSTNESFVGCFVALEESVNSFNYYWNVEEKTKFTHTRFTYFAKNDFLWL